MTDATATRTITATSTDRAGEELTAEPATADPESTGTGSRRQWPAPRHPHRWWLAAILVSNAVMGVWDLQRMGLQNAYYAAAAWSAGKSWHAFFFAGLDPAGGATIDKPPLAVWVQGLSIRVFGFNSSGLLVPQVLMGVTCSGLLYLTVRRLTGTTAGLLAAALLTFTPVAVWMFKSDNPDPLMVLLLVASAYFLVRALDSGSIPWMAACGAAVGFAFEAKMLEAVIVLPGLVLAYLICGGGGLGKRLLGLAAAGATMVVTGLWWMVLVQSTPASERPYISSTNTNSVFELAFGYNGAARLGASASTLRMTDRLFVGAMGSLISYLLPAALIATAVLLIGPRGGRRSAYRATGLLFGGWLIAGAVTLTYSTGLINVYYVLVIAPAIAALVATAGAGLWRHRDQPAAVVPLTLMVAVTAIWGAVELDPAHHAAAWWSVLIAAVALGWTAVVLRRAAGSRLTGVGAALMTLAILLPTTAAALAQVGTVHEPTMYYSRQPALLAALSGDRSGDRFAAAVVGGLRAADLELETGRPVLDIGGYHGSNDLPSLPTLERLVLTHQIHYLERTVGHAGRPAPHAEIRPAVARAQAINAGHTVLVRVTKPAPRHTATRPVAHTPVPIKPPSVGTLFMRWVVAHYPVTYSDGTDRLYDLFTPIRHHRTHTTRSPARQTAKVIGRPTRYAR